MPEDPDEYNSEIMTYVRPVRFEVSVIPPRFTESGDGSDTWTLLVTYRGNDKWAVAQGDDMMASYCLGADGIWSWRPDKEHEDAAWCAEHWFSFEDAMELARRNCPYVTVYGKTALDILEAQLAEERGDHKAGPEA
jgi:hypothetical protein